MVFIPQTSIAQEEPPRSPRETLPTMYDLPSEYPEEPGLADEFHALQPQLLSRTLRLIDYAPENYFSALDLNIYYNVTHPIWHKRPDWFLALNVPRLYEGKELRRSYVVWQEEQSPYIVVELLSPGTAQEDLGRFYRESEKYLEETRLEEEPQTTPRKLEVYEKYLRVPHYFVYSRYTQKLRYFKLEGGVYKEQSLQSENPKVWLEDLKIGLGIWEGVFAGVRHNWLRWYDAEGNWLLTDTEQAQLEKEQAQAQLRQAAKNLLVSGMSASQVAQILGISVEDVEESATQNDSSRDREI